MRRILDRIVAGARFYTHMAPPTSPRPAPLEQPMEEALPEQVSAPPCVDALGEAVAQISALMGENDELQRQVKLLTREVQRVSLLAAARLEFEGARVQTPRGPGLVTYCGHEIEVILDTGDVFYARYPTELPRLTEPDARLAAIERKELKWIRKSPWTDVQRVGNYETVIMRAREPRPE